jgi:hypothetical protein
MESALRRLLFVSAWLACAHALAADTLTPPAALHKRITAPFDACVRKAEKAAAAAGQLLPTGTAACYDAAKAQWRAALEQAKDRIGRSRNANCAAALQQVEQRWNAYADELGRIKPLAALPLSTDDDIELALLQHLYDLSYLLARSGGCGAPKDAARRR